MTKAELAAAAEELFNELIKGDDPEDVADVMGWDDQVFEAVKREMLSSKIEELRTMSPEAVYVEYVIAQRRNIKDLDSLVRNLDDKKQYNAVIGALRLRSDITDKMLDRRFQLGLTKRQDAASSLGQGNSFTFVSNIEAMTAPQLRTAITDQMSELQGMMKKFGDSKNLLELPVGQLHYGDAIEVEAIEAPKDDGNSKSSAPVKKKKAIKKL